MLKKQVKIGATYHVRLHGNYTTVRIQEVLKRTKIARNAGVIVKRYEIDGGWLAINLSTGRQIHIKSAAKLMYEVVQLNQTWG